MISTVHIHAHTSYRYSVKNLKLVLNCMYSESWSRLCRIGMLGTSPILGVCVVPFSWFRFTLTCVCVCTCVCSMCSDSGYSGERAVAEEAQHGPGGQETRTGRSRRTRGAVWGPQISRHLPVRDVYVGGGGGGGGGGMGKGEAKEEG